MDVGLSCLRSWDIEGCLGTGHFGKVYRARQTGDNIKYAIKVINNVEYCKRIQTWSCELPITTEANVLATLDHPNILKLHQWYMSESTCIQILTFMDGGDLCSDVIENGPYAELNAFRLCVGICVGLQYLQDRRVIHRDIKTDNILLTTKERGTAESVISDFGFAKQFPVGFVLTNGCRTFIGTLQYMAPEMLACREGSSSTYSFAVDVWAFGIVFYVCLSGYFPFDTENTYTEVLRGTIDFDDDDVWTTVQPRTVWLLGEMLNKDPTLRCSLRTIFEEIRHFIACSAEHLDSESLL